MTGKPFAVVTSAGKAVRYDILEQYAVKEESKQLPPDRFIEKYGEMGLVQPLYNPEALAKLIEINTYHYRCCKTKARDTAGLGWSIKPLGGKNSSTDSPVYKELDSFFSELPETCSQILDKLMLDYEAVGYAALEMVRENDDPEGKPVLLAHVPVHTLRVHADSKRFVQIRNGKKRWFKRVEYPYDVHKDTGVISPLKSLQAEDRASEIIWFVNYTPRSDYYGLPDIIPALGAIWGDIARRDYNIAFFDNYGVPAYAIFVSGNFDPGEVDEEGRTEMEKMIEEHFAELAKNPHSTLILSIPTEGREEEVKIEFKALSTEVKEASFRLYRNDNRDEILSAHGMPPYRIGVNETGSLGGSTAVESTEIYKMSVIEPRQEMLEAAINRYIVWGAFKTDDWEFKLAEIDTTDEKLDLEIIASLFEKGAITPNQIIRHFKNRFGLEEVDHPAMNAHYVNGRAIDIEEELILSGEEGLLDEAEEVFQKYQSETEQALLSLNQRLIEIAEKSLK